MKKKILFLAVSIVAITLLMPRNVLLEMTMTRGSIWKESTLTAPFEIPLLKSDKQLEEDRNLIESSFEPIYSLDTEEISSISDPEIRELFKKGIINDAEAEHSKSGSIRIVEGSTIRHTALSSVPTVGQVKKAAEEADSSDRKIRIPASLKYEEQLSKDDYNALYSKISQTNDIIHQGDVIVTEGQIVDAQTQLRIDSYVQEYKSRMGTDVWWLLVDLGRIAVLVLIMGCNLLFFNRFLDKGGPDSFRKFSFMIGSYVVILSMLFLLRFIRTGGATLPYVVPLVIVPVLFLLFFGTKAAIIGNITISTTAALFTQLPFEYFTVNMLAGMTAILLLHTFYRRNELFKAMGLIFAVELLTLFAFRLIEGYSLLAVDSMKSLVILIVNNILLLGIYQFAYIVEKTFGFTSDITLVENSDTNQPLLLELSHKAPGTFQHSVQVANIAEAAAKLIGANPLLVRCGALYHDIGKMVHPEYFIENTGGGYNPHDECTPEESAAIIKGHVTDGLEIGRAHHLPECITRFIETHHGDSTIQYFYHKAKEASPDVDPKAFKYPGQNPKTREECICMMCDSIEAASRTLPSYDKQSINDLVENMVRRQIAEGHFSNSELTFDEVYRIKELLKTLLQNIYHVRIAYPK